MEQLVDAIRKIAPDDMYRHLYTQSVNSEYSFVHLFRIRIEPASACNLRCIYCPTGSCYDDPVVSKQIMSGETYYSILKQIRNVKTLSRATFYLGGEPLINKHLVNNIVRLSERTKVTHVDFVTNGMLIDEQFCIELSKVKVANFYIQISIDGKNRGENDRFRVGANYEKIKENVFMLRKMLPENFLVWITNVYIPTENELSEKPQIPTFLLEDFSELANNKYGQFRITSCYSQIWPGLDEQYILDQGFLKKKAGLRGFCAFPFYEVSIRANGDVVPCCYDIRNENVMGNIHKEKLTEILNSPGYRRLRKALIDFYISGSMQELPEMCKKCVVNSGELLYR